MLHHFVPLPAFSSFRINIMGMKCLIQLIRDAGWRVLAIALFTMDYTTLSRYRIIIT